MEEKQVGKRRKVAIVYKNLPQYRRKFFELLRVRLAERNIELVLIYGQPGDKDRKKKDTVDLSWAHKIRNRILRIGGKELYWQPCLGELRGTELVIVEQASKLLVNYYLWLKHLLGGRKLAFWGHGRNFQGHTASPLGEWIKRAMSRHVHWWFSYNRMSAEVVKSIGFPEERITLVQNAIDTTIMQSTSERLDEALLDQLRAELGIGKDDPVCLYAGGMYAEKRLDFLLEACRRIRERLPNFHMIFLGAGEQDEWVKTAGRENDWIHYMGPRFDADKVPYFRLSKLFLMPGLVGLAVLDTFALGVPIVTTRLPYHSPEIEYLEQGINGMLLDDPEDLQGYVNTVVRILTSPEEHRQLVEGALQAGRKYTVEEMASRFAEGVAQALDIQGKRESYADAGANASTSAAGQGASGKRTYSAGAGGN